MSTITTGDLKLIRPEIDDNIAQSITDMSTNFQKIDSGVTSNANALSTHLDEKAGQIIRVKRDVSLSGDQIVSGFNRIPQLLLIDTVVSDTKKVSYGRVDADAQFGIYMRGDTGDVAFTGSPLSIDDTSVKRSRASVTINGDKTITLSWVHASGGGTGVADICITAFYHGEDSQ